MRPTMSQLRKLVGVANYQFGSDAGMVLFTGRVHVTCSRRTGRMRHIYRNGKLVATLRPKDGYLALTPDGAEILLSKMTAPHNLVAVQGDVAEEVKKGGDAFAKHVVRADSRLRPAEEVIITDEQGQLLGVGRAVLSGTEMLYFKRGVAVKLRKGILESAKDQDPFSD